MFAITQDKLDSFNQCMADLLVIALFFCLCSCKYTKTNYDRRTNQFIFQDMQFHDANGVIPPDAAVDIFLTSLDLSLFSCYS